MGVHTHASQEPHLVTLSRVRRIRGHPNDIYEVIFLDQYDQIIVPLTEWYRLRKDQGPRSTRETYLTCLQPFLTFLADRSCPWNAPPERLRPVLIEFHRDRLGCQIHPRRDRDGIEIVPTRETPICDSTLRVMRAALRDFYLVLKEAGLYAFSNPLSSEVLVALKREHQQALANSGAPDQAGIRGESHEQSRRRPSAFIRYPKAKEWQPELRKELADVRAGIHAVLDCMIDDKQLPLREKAVLELLRNTGARLHEVVLMTIGGYRNEGIAGQAQVIDKGSHGRLIKTIYFGHNPKVQQTLSRYLDQIRPLHDPHGRAQVAELGQEEPLFLTKRGTAYTVKDFYYFWYKYYPSFQTQCPVCFSPHDIRHLFISEFLIILRQKCGAGTDHFDSERYLRERDAFARTIMGWRSSRTIDIYDHTRDGESSLQVLATYQQDLSKRRYVIERESDTEPNDSERETALPAGGQVPLHQHIELEQTEETIWLHDAETMAWINKLQQSKTHDGREDKGL